MALQPGATLGPYEILSLIGAGGMGEVYLARELSLGRRVALKVLPPEFTHDPHRIARFEQEARSASALSHPNICTIFAVGELPDGRRFIAMEYIDGQTLRHRLTTERLSLREAIDIGSQMAAGVSAAHALGIVHRDLKPENVLIRQDGLVKVVDFGLAKLSPARDPKGGGTTHLDAKTDPGSAVGTIAYMSPEQARAQEVDGRTDIWSLGVLLYEMVAGRSPFSGQSSSDVLAAILQNDPAPLARFDPDAPPELQRIVGKALRKDRSQRYQTVQDLLLDLQALREDMQSHARVESTTSTPITTGSVARSSGQSVTPPPPGGLRVKLALASAVLVIGAVLGVWAWRTARPAQMPVATGPLIQRNLTRLTFGAGLQMDVTWSPDGTRIAYAADRSGNFDIWSQPIDGGDPVQVTKSPASDTQPSWSPDGRHIVFRSERDGGGLFVVPARGGPERKLSSFGVHPQWSPDGAAIMFYGEPLRKTDVYRVSPEGGDPPREMLGDFLREGWWEWIAFHPDGRLSLIGDHRQRGPGFFTVSPKDGHVTTSSIPPGFPLRVARQGTRLRRFQWNATGDTLFAEATVNEVQNVWKINVEPKTLAWLSAERLTAGMGADAAAALSADGARLLFTTQRQSKRLWIFPFDAAAGRLIGEGRPVSPDEAEVTDGALAADGRTVAYGLRRAGSDRADLWLTHLDSGASELLAANAYGPCWSPDGKMIAYDLIRPDRPPPGEWALAVRELGGAERVLSRWSSQRALMPQDWTRDGRAILVVNLSPIFTGLARLQLWPADNATATAPDRVVVKDARARIWQGRYSPDGRWLSFVAESMEQFGFGQLAVVPAVGRARAEWTQIAREHRAPDKPRWGPDGRTIYFVSTHNSSGFNLWGSRFDTTRGKPDGEPFMITHFDAPGLVISPDVVGSEMDISAHRAMLTMTTVTGNIWMLDHVDR